MTNSKILVIMKDSLFKSIVFLAALFSSTLLHASFFVQNEDGVMILYNIISYEDKTCEVTSDSKPAFYSGVVRIPATIKTNNSVEYKVIGIGEKAFDTCYDLTDVTIPISVKSIGKNAFIHCSRLTSVTIPNSVITIGESAFMDCKGLTSLTIGNFVKSIEDWAFSSCSGLTSLNIPNSVTSIGCGSFESCTGLTSVTIGNSVTSIGQNAFSGCTGLTSVMIPNSVTEIGNLAFGFCTGLTSVTIPNSVTSIEGCAFYCCSSLSSVAIPNSVTSINFSTFERCENLTSVTIPNSVTSIGDDAFKGCTNLTSVTIPHSVTSIGDDAFNGCYSLRNITSEITDVFATGTNAFLGCSSDAKLQVPVGTADDYRSTADWNRFSNIVEYERIVTMTMACNTMGRVLVNSAPIVSNEICEVEVKDNVENRFAFLPDSNCSLTQVVLNGQDVTASVSKNILKIKTPEGSQMMVVFGKKEGASADLNGDGSVDISDVVYLVNMILGQ